MFRAGIRIRPHSHVVSNVNRRAFTYTTPKFFFDKAPSPEQQEQAFNKVKKIMSENPELMQLTVEFKELLSKKGLLSTGKPSISQMMKLLADKEVREHGAKLKNFLDSKETGLTQEELATLTGAYMFQNKDLK
ncbi:hypothetical protein FOB58_003588 [Candida parapsilosis]|mgnify:CR=1 FL=1|uniref:Uncharacterized protein n=2 Tax=Candida parapsilosis TaxID=5480 RepID=G8BIF3_CANPC|nr:uncharacterized protein CPAR2_402190 [Candida parapsilosis]KAF6047115.1 hypothetical protein FOB60_004651 [Candida parapsilosis]KAF6047510.1 hypothetical protein FOB58_003588 [Candida parapsilosis]KAF6050517.1 hypothetical protein FOB59_002763 [Candida parapsilosis]KAF6061638.1 hypothetical protein FOB61_004395 [Candida parapsilosis]KAI5901677.1 hypothetical protein K4G60_g815 [Candida parapsilosis]